MLLQQIPLTADVPELGTLAINLGIALVLGQVLGWHFVQVLSNKRKLARVLMFIAATTVLIITVVASSLALSLGLVGALSIIRFRTPVKEPEELAYLFLAIASSEVVMSFDRCLPRRREC
jgi:zinc transporter ZupT